MTDNENKRYYAACLFCEEYGYFDADDVALCSRCYTEVMDIREIDQVNDE